MIKKIFLSLATIAMVLSMTISPVLAAETADPNLGAVVKIADSDTLYYIAADGKRYVYPNEKIYKSWFFDFSEVKTISAEDLAKYPLNGNIRYRPGVILIKVQTDPKVYAVGQGGILRWIKNELLAKKLYGDNWASLIDDLPASFFANYQVGEDIDDDADYDADDEAENTDTVEKDRGLHLGQFIVGKKSNTIRCRVISRVRSLMSDHSKRFDNLFERICKPDDDDDDDDQADKTAPVISDVSVTASTTSAVISWKTDELATSKVTYATEPKGSADDTDSVVKKNLVTNHAIKLTGLTASTTYYFIVESNDANGNKATTTEKMFTTSAVPPADVTAPVISNISVSASTTFALVSWTTNEAASSQIEYAVESLSTASTTIKVENSSLVTNHSLNVSSLTASTTYYFIIESKDASNNKATSTQQVFTTLGQ
ncbi:MAG: fibronectin type III domain-containing protein [Candidatus Buchananbacteria bacterium]|nr:fibronectin type III domain-containing protein [Candidatus Buchananbacteria bacterium]